MTAREVAIAVSGVLLGVIVIVCFATGDWSPLFEGLACLCLGRAAAAYRNERDQRRKAE